MKTFICFAVVILCTNALDQEFVNQIREKMKSQVEECAKEVSASSNDVQDLFAHKMPESREGKCILFCMHKIYSAQNADGSLNMPGALANLELIKDMDADLYEKLVGAFKACESTPVDSDPCIFASNLATCIIQEGKARGIPDVPIS